MISVCLATFNGALYIHEQVTSILMQLSENDELIVSDDGSKDDTLEILSSFRDNRIKVYLNTGEHGFVRNFENALCHAKGEYIFLSDQDDKWRANKIKVVLSYLEHYDMVLHDAEIVDQNGASMCRLYSESLHHGTGFWANMWKTRWLGCCMAFNSRVLEYAMPFPKHTVGHDYWISLIGLAKYSYVYIPDVLIDYRRHGSNSSSASGKSGNNIYYMIVTKRLWTLIEVVKRVVGM